MRIVPHHVASTAAFLALFLPGGISGIGALDGANPNDAPVAQAAMCTLAEECPPVMDGTRLHWVSRTGNGDLYLLLRADCRGGAQCGAWFVERTARGMVARLNVEGRFQVLSSGKAVPDVQTWQDRAENEFEVTRYSWSAGAYRRTETRTVYSVNGEVCGSSLECYQKAQGALRERRTDEALRIWEQVHNVSYI